MTGLELAEARLRARVESELARELGQRAATRPRLEDQQWVYQLVGRLVSEEQARGGLDLDRNALSELWRRVFGAVTPLGPLAEHLADPEVEEVRINGTGACFVVRGGRRLPVPVPFTDEQALVDLVHWYADGLGGGRLDRSSPTVTLILPDGSRLHAALSPPARPSAVTIRRHPAGRFRQLEDLVTAGFLPAALVPFLRAAVEGRLNILVAGGAGTGKTTLVRVLCRLIPAEQRVVTVEDHAELGLWRELADCVSLEGREANTEGRGAIGIQRLVTEALRMSPDRIVVGEVRGAEALDLLDAMNTGHPGSLCTVHAESPRDTLPRLSRLALRSPQAPRPEAVLAEVASTIDLVLFVGFAAAEGSRRRRLLSASCVAGLEGGRPLMQELVAGSAAGWRRVGSPAAMPEPARSKLAAVADLATLLDGFDA